MTLIEVHDLSVKLGGREVLSHVDLKVERGEIVTIVGPNGSGKTTLVRALIGAVRPSAGEVVRAPGLRIGYVPQKLALEPTLPLTVRRFLSLPKRVSVATALAVLDEAGAGNLLERQMTELSGGQFQRVLLARALIGAPDLLVLDEATQGLDQPGAADFYAQIEAVRDRLDLGVVMVSHDLHVVMAASDRVICLNGHICCQGKPEQVASAPEYRALFGTDTHGALALYRHQHHHRHDGLDHHDHA